MAKKKYGSKAGAKAGAKAASKTADKMVKGKTMFKTAKDLVPSNKMEAFKYGGGTPKKPVNDFFEKMKCGGLTKK